MLTVDDSGFAVANQYFIDANLFEVAGLTITVDGIETQTLHTGLADDTVTIALTQPFTAEHLTLNGGTGRDKVVVAEGVVYTAQITPIYTEDLTVDGGGFAPGGFSALDAIQNFFVPLDYVQTSAGTLYLDLGDAVTGCDQLQVGSTVTLAGLLSLSLLSPHPADLYTLIDNIGSSPVVGTFENYPEGATLLLNGRRFRLSYEGGTGNDVVLYFYPSLSVSDYSNYEGSSGNTTFTFLVSLSAGSPLPITVEYTTVAGSAIAPNDFAAVSGTLTFNPGETSKSIDITVVGDTMYELNETFSLNLSDPVFASLEDEQGQATVLNDDTQPALSITNVMQDEGNNGTTVFAFTVSLTNASYQSVSVDFTTADGTATIADNDYVATNGTLTFAPGETTKTIYVTVNGDTTLEAVDTFFVNLSNVLNALVWDDQGEGIIENDD